MSRFVDSFKDHPVHEALKELEEESFRLSEHAVQMGSNLGQQAAESADRLEDAYHYISDRLARANPIITSQQNLDNLQSRANQTVQAVRNFISRHTKSHLNQIDSNCDNLIHAASLLPVIENVGDVKGLHQAIVKMRRSAGQHRKNLNDEFKKLKQKVKALQEQADETATEIKSQKSRLDDAISRHEKQFSEASDTRRERFTNQVDKFQDETRAVLKEWEQKLQEFETNSMERLAKTGKELKESAEQAQGKFREQADERVAELDKLKENAEKVVGSIATTGMIERYKAVADEESNSVGRFQKATVLSLVILGGLAVWLLFSALTTDMSLSATIAKVFLILTFGGLAAYCASQAERHRKAARAYRDTELRLRALEPYLATLSDDDQKELRKELSGNFFASPITDGQHSAEDQFPPPTSASGDIVRRLVEILGDVTGPAGK